MHWTVIIWLAVGWLCGSVGGCLPPHYPPEIQGLPLSPGRYLARYYRSPDFDPAQASYRLENFSLEEIKGLDHQQAGRWFQEELAQAFENNGLPLRAGAARCIVSGTVSRFYLRGPILRFLTGKSSATLRARGEIRRGKEIVFAFRDQIRLSLPVNPRYPSALEDELIARQAISHFASNLLNEMLLPALRPPPGQPDAAGFQLRDSWLKPGRDLQKRAKSGADVLHCSS